MPELEERLSAVSQFLPYPNEDAKQRGWQAIVAEHGQPDAYAQPALAQASQTHLPTLGRRSRWQRRLAFGSVAAVAIAVGVMFQQSRGSGGSSLVERAAAAVDKPGEIEHVKSTSDGLQYEYWSLPGKSSLSVITGPNGSKNETRAGPICSVLGRRSPTATGCVSTGEALKDALSSGEAHLLPDGVVGGRPVKRIAFTVRDSAGISGTYEVDPETLTPVRLTIHMPYLQTVTEDYSVFEYLPATAENLALLGSPTP